MRLSRPVIVGWRSAVGAGLLLAGGWLLSAPAISQSPPALSGQDDEVTSRPVSGASVAPSGDVSTDDRLPPPTTLVASVVLLVGSTDALTDRESRWLDEMRVELGSVATLAYADATTEHLRSWSVVVVLDTNPGLDVRALAGAHARRVSSSWRPSWVPRG